MMRTATVADAKSHLSALLAEVEAGKVSLSLAGESQWRVSFPSRDQGGSTGLICAIGCLYRQPRD